MGDNSKIEWTDATWNPIRARNRATGGVGHFCIHASDGCRHCYAERLQPRFGNPVRYGAPYRDQVELLLDDAALLQPLRWRRPRRIFVCSMTDLFLAEHPEPWLDQVFAVAALCPQHTFQILTKRPERARGYADHPGAPRRVYEIVCDIAVEQWVDVILTAARIGGGPPGTEVELDRWPLPNVWLGTSVEDQWSADTRVPELLATPAAVRFVSAEPLLGRLRMPGLYPVGDVDGFIDTPRLDWVIVGGESGPDARPMHPDWARAIRDQCQAAGVPFLFKQWGEWAPTPWRGGRVAVHHQFDDRTTMIRRGKKDNGRVLDERIWDDYPPAVPAIARH